MWPRLTPALTQRPVHRLTLTRLRRTLILLRAPILRHQRILTSRQPVVMSPPQRLKLTRTLLLRIPLTKLRQPLILLQAHILRHQRILMSRQQAVM